MSQIFFLQEVNAPIMKQHTEKAACSKEQKISSLTKFFSLINAIFNYLFYKPEELTALIQKKLINQYIQIDRLGTHVQA